MYVLLNEPFRFLRYQYKKAVILFNSSLPIEINHEALEILRLCDGTNSVNDIICELSKLYINEKKVGKYVNDFLMDLSNNKIITFLNKANDEPVEILIEGSKDYWSPLHATLELTHNCPLKCKHCYINAGKGNTMANDYLEQLVDDLVGVGVRSVQLTGGEPFLHPYIVNAIDKFNDSAIRINITTSGYYYNTDILNAISKIKDGYIQVSLDGLEETHNSIRGKADAFENTVKFITEVVNMEKKVVVATCYMHQSYDELLGLCNMIKNIGCAGIRFGVVENKGRARDNCSEDEIGNYDILKEVIQSLKDKYLEESFFIDIEEEQVINKHGFVNCGAGYNSVKINPLGEVYDCIFSNKAIGVIKRDEGIKGFLKSNAEFMDERSKLVAPCKSVCGDCTNLDICEGCLVKGRESNCKKKSVFNDIH